MLKRIMCSSLTHDPKSLTFPLQKSGVPVCPQTTKEILSLFLRPPGQWHTRLTQTSFRKADCYIFILKVVQP